MHVEKPRIELVREPAPIVPLESPRRILTLATLLMLSPVVLLMVLLWLVLGEP